MVSDGFVKVGRERRQRATGIDVEIIKLKMRKMGE